MIGELEAQIAADYPAARVMALNSCMGALHVALQTVGVGPGDEIIVDPIVVFGGMAAMYHNAVPVFADIDRQTFTIDPASVADCVTARTKAVICTHLFGNICDMEALLAVCRPRGIAVIEDCAHALHATRAGVRAGLLGDFAAFSFNHRKQLSTGQGGFLLINSPEYAERSRDKSFGRVPPRLLWNYAMPGVVAALALAQWDPAREYVRRDHEFGCAYSAAVGGCPWLKLQQIPANNWSSYHVWAAVFTGDSAGIGYPAFIEALRANGGDYFLPSFMPYGAFGLDPSPAYRYPIFSEPRAYTKRCPTFCPHYEGVVDYSVGRCPAAEYIVPRLLNTVISPVPDERLDRYVAALAATIAQFS